MRDRIASLTRPIIGIENRTAQEAFDIMADRIRGALSTPTTPDEGLRAFAEAYVAAWEAGTGTVYLIDAARAALKGER